MFARDAILELLWAGGGGGRRVRVWVDLAHASISVNHSKAVSYLLQRLRSIFWQKNSSEAKRGVHFVSLPYACLCMFMCI